MPHGLEDDIERIVKALGRVYREEGSKKAADLLSTARMALQETRYDNWNGGTYGYTLQLEVPVRTFAELGPRAGDLEVEIRSRIQRLTRLYSNEAVESVIIVPSLDDEGTAAQSGSIVDVPSFWKEGYLRLFLSHVSTFKVEASGLARSLEHCGVSGFVAHEDIEPTKEWENEIRLGLATCDALACLLTPEFPQSKWTDQEVGFAIGRGVLVVPVRLGIDPYGFMGRYQAHSGVKKSTEEMAVSLVTTLARHRLTGARMAEGLLVSFEGSPSFMEAKQRAARLNLIRSWSDETRERIRRAVKENDQISGAFGVPRLVEDLLSTKGPQLGT